MTFELLGGRGTADVASGKLLARIDEPLDYLWVKLLETDAHHLRAVPKVEH